MHVLACRRLRDKTVVTLDELLYEIQESYRCPITQIQMKAIWLQQVADITTWLEPFIQLKTFGIRYPHCFKLWKNPGAVRKNADDVLLSARFMAYRPKHKLAQWWTRIFISNAKLIDDMQRVGRGGGRSMGEPNRVVPAAFNEAGFRETLNAGKALGIVTESHIDSWSKHFDVMNKLRADDCEQCLQLFDAYKAAPHGKKKKGGGAETTEEREVRRERDRTKEKLKKLFNDHRKGPHPGITYTNVVDGTNDGPQPFWSNTKQDGTARHDALPRQNELAGVYDLFPDICNDSNVNEDGRLVERAAALLTSSKRKNLKQMEDDALAFVDCTKGDNEYLYKYPFGLLASVLDKWDGNSCWGDSYYTS